MNIFQSRPPKTQDNKEMISIEEKQQGNDNKPTGKQDKDQDEIKMKKFKKRKPNSK